MWRLLLVPSLVFGQEAAPRRVEVLATLGVFTLAPGGADVLIQARRPEGRWLVGVRFAQWVDTSHDPFTGRALTDTRESRAGITVDYLFRPDRRFSWMLGGGVFRWTKRETSLITGEVGPDAATGPFVGGGFLGRIGNHFTYQAGIYLAPGVSLHTHTSVSSEDDSGSFDVRAGIGVRF